MTETRVPAGVPTGGQFAASARTEADVSLSQPTERDDADLVRAATAFNDITGLTADLTDAVENRSLVADVLTDCPDAAFITITDYDDGNGPDAHLVIRDADDNVLDQRIAPFRPDGLDSYDRDGYALDVDEVQAVDIDALAEEMDRALLANILSRRPHWGARVDASAADVRVSYTDTARAQGCFCDFNPSTTEGPEYECPVHGAAEFRMSPEEKHRDLVSRLGFGDGITEPMASNNVVVEHVAQMRMRLSEYDEKAFPALPDDPAQEAARRGEPVQDPFDTRPVF